MDFEPKILGIACNWCTYTGADLAGTTRLKYPQNVRTVRVMCSSRINPSFIIRAFQLGADGVLVGGCHPGDCHYGTGNLYARRKLAVTRQILDFPAWTRSGFVSSGSPLRKGINTPRSLTSSPVTSRRWGRRIHSGSRRVGVSAYDRHKTDRGKPQEGSETIAGKR